MNRNNKKPIILLYFSFSKRRNKHTYITNLQLYTILNFNTIYIVDKCIDYRLILVTNVYCSIIKQVTNVN